MNEAVNDTANHPAGPRRIIVIVDEDARGCRAARWATELAHKLAVEVVAITPLVNASTEHSPDDLVGFELDRSMAMRAWLAERGVDITEFIVADRDLDDELVQEADHNDLVVVGADAEEGITKWALGCRPHDLAHRLACPLIIVPPAGAVSDDAPLVVGVDGTDGNRGVVEWTKAIAGALDRPIRAIHVRDPMYDTFDSAGDKGPVERAARREAQIEGVQLHERAGQPADGLSDVARELQPFLLVVGARQDHSFGGRLLGSLVDSLIHTPPAVLAIVTDEYLG